VSQKKVRYVLAVFRGRKTPAGCRRYVAPPSRRWVSHSESGSQLALRLRCCGVLDSRDAVLDFFGVSVGHRTSGYSGGSLECGALAPLWKAGDWPGKRRRVFSRQQAAPTESGGKPACRQAGHRTSRVPSAADSGLAGIIRCATCGACPACPERSRRERSRGEPSLTTIEVTRE
jgi:hypothetical protein